MTLLKRLLLVTLFAAVGSLVHAEPEPGQTRGQLLYTTHCIACHTTQMHWRNDRQAQDWDSLQFQVRRWQGNAGLKWSEADITEVSRHLNETIYHFRQPAVRVGVSGRQPLVIASSGVPR